MLNKLFKYDFKWITKVLYIYYIVIAFVSIALKIVEHFVNTDPSLLLVIVDKTLVSLFIGAVASVMINTIMRIWARCVSNFYKDESYLTHTLPVTKSELFNSKVLAGICSLLLSTLVIVVCLAFIYLNKSSIESIKIMWNSLVAAYNLPFAVCFVIGFILIIVLEVIYMMMCGVLGITIGHRFNNYKMLKSILIGLVSYGLLSLVSLIIVFIITKYVEADVVNGFPSMSYIGSMGTTALIIYTVYNIVYYLIAKKVFNKGVNVE